MSSWRAKPLVSQTMTSLTFFLAIGASSSPPLSSSLNEKGSFIAFIDGRAATTLSRERAADAREVLSVAGFLGESSSSLLSSEELKSMSIVDAVLLVVAPKQLNQFQLKGESEEVRKKKPF